MEVDALLASLLLSRSETSVLTTCSVHDYTNGIHNGSSNQR